MRIIASPSDDSQSKQFCPENRSFGTKHKPKFNWPIRKQREKQKKLLQIIILLERFGIAISNQPHSQSPQGQCILSVLNVLKVNASTPPPPPLIYLL